MLIISCVIVAECLKYNLFHIGKFPLRLYRNRRDVMVLKAKPQTYLIVLPVKNYTAAFNAVHVIFVCTFFSCVDYCLSALRCWTVYDYNVSLLASLPK